MHYNGGISLYQFLIYIDNEVLVDWGKCIFKNSQAKVWNASKCPSIFGNDCSAGIGWVTDQGFWTVIFLPSHLWSACPREGNVALLTHLCGHGCVFIWWGRGWRKDGRKTCKTQLLSWEREEPSLGPAGPLPAHCQAAVAQSRCLGVSVYHHSASTYWCWALLCDGAGGTRCKHTKWANNPYNLKCGLLYTLWRLGTFICNPYRIAGREGWPHFTDEKAEVYRSQERGASQWPSWNSNMDWVSLKTFFSHYDLFLPSPRHSWIAVKLQIFCGETPRLSLEWSEKAPCTHM